MPYQSKMWSWNQDYFEGLKEIGEAYAGRNDYEHFSEYCLIKEAGLKKKANAKANDFVKHISLLSVERCREIVVDLAELNYQHPKVHSLINHPIGMMMRESLRMWTEEEPESLLAHRWYGFYGEWSEAFEIALRIDPYDQISLSRLTRYLLNDVDYATHHLNESLFIGSAVEASESLKQAISLVAKIQDQKLREALNEDVEYYSNLLNLWTMYKSTDQESSFPKWTRTKGHELLFHESYYY